MALVHQAIDQLAIYCLEHISGLAWDILLFFRCLGEDKSAEFIKFPSLPFAIHYFSFHYKKLHTIHTYQGSRKFLRSKAFLFSFPFSYICVKYAEVYL